MNNNIIIMIGPAILLVTCNVLYHISQKSIPVELNPIISATVSLLIALVISIIILPIFITSHEMHSSIRNFNWANLLSGISASGVIISHVLYYRSGWSLSTGTLFSYVTVCIILIPIGIFIFREKMNFYNIIGIIISFIGLYLITKQ